MTRAKDISKILTDADISGNIDVDGVTNLDVVDIDGAVDMASTLAVTGALSAKGGAVFNEDSADVDFRVESNGNANMLFVDGGNDKIGVGTSSPARQFTIQNTIANAGGELGLLSSDSNTSGTFGTLHFGNNTDTSLASIRAVADGSTTAGKLEFNTEPNGGAIETRMTINSVGNILVGLTGRLFYDHNGTINVTAAGDAGIKVNRSSDTGNFIAMGFNGTQRGQIGSDDSHNIYLASQRGAGISVSDQELIPTNASGVLTDNFMDVGHPSYRFDDVRATNGTIQTSDRNDKQDIEELTDAEKRVAVVAKGLMRKFRWKDNVIEKGDKARTHFGIIAQDLQDAFTAESLDATKYAMFCSDTWWQKEIPIDAVKAVDEVKDEEGNITTHAVEAKDAYIQIDVKDEATTGYTEKTRLGVRYSELLAFIITAI